MKKQIVHIQGMHCRSCEILLEDGITEIHGVRAVNVSHTKGTAEISYKGHLDFNAVQSVVEEAGYVLGEGTKAPFVTYDTEEWNQLSGAALLLVLLYFIGRWVGLFELGNAVSNNYSSLPVVFLVGLTAGVSTCMALVGGLVLGNAAKFAKQRPWATAREKFTPHIMFNVGRIASFIVLGAVIGGVGSVLQLSMSLIGFLTILVGISMLFLGLQLVSVFPRISRLQLTLPKGVSKALGFDQAKQAEYSNKNSAILGGLTFFLPCGFTQAMQLYAMSTGSPLAGALTMGTFALGTAPGLLGIGGLTSAVKGESAKYFFKFAGLVVILLSIFNVSNGLNLTGWKSSLGLPVSAQSKQEKANVLGATQGETQVLKATYSPQEGVLPENFTVKVGQPVRVEVLAKENGSGCMGSFAIPGLTKNVAGFKKGQTVVMEFTPTKTGTYQMTCAMGIPHGTITVKS
jgi:sulfite exporter TauE/SafE/copper chaperone CopZ